MRRALFKNVSLYATTFTKSSQIPHYQTLNLIHKFNLPIFHRFFSEESGPSDQNPNPPTPPPPPAGEETTLETTGIEAMKTFAKEYSEADEEKRLSIRDGILTNIEEAIGDELTVDEFFQSLEDDGGDSDSESEFNEAAETDDDIQDLGSAKEVIVKRMLQDEYFNMDDKKWNAIVDEAKEHGIVDDPKECEEILEDMLYWDKLLPGGIKKMVQAKYDELTEKMKTNGLGVEEAYEQFKVFEDEIVAEHIKKDEEERLLPESDEVVKPVDKKSDDPPGVGPILRWQTRLVLVPGGDAWHPKNRKVKLSVTVKELRLSKWQFRRMREIVGKRYHPGKDELTITSERFEHREENRKDCLRTLLSIIEEAGKATALVDEARIAYVKETLKANPDFMARLHAKTKQALTAIPA